MGLQNFQIYFDNPAGAYFGGQTLSGKVEVSLNSVKRIRGIQIVFKGGANTHWTESENTTNSEGKDETQTVSYVGSEEYFNINYYLLGGPNSEPIELPAGQHVYPFTCALPPTLPSSFEGEEGFVRYTVKVILDRPWKFDQTIKAAFTIIAPLDLNVNPRIREPATLTMEKYFCCWFCKSGPLTGIVKIPCTGFVCGQVIPLTIEIDNASTTEVQGVTLKMIKAVTYYSQSPRRNTKKHEVKLLEYKVGSSIAARGSNTFTQNINIPSIPPSNLANCGIIDIDYELKFEVIVSGFHRNMHGNIPIMIGTVPLNNMVPMQQQSTTIDMNTGPTQPAFGWVPAPAGDPGNPYILPPPTYEESQFGTKNILDSNDSEHTKFNNNHYSPMYPVYNFNLPMTQGHYNPSAPVQPM